MKRSAVDVEQPGADPAAAPPSPPIRWGATATVIGVTSALIVAAWWMLPRDTQLRDSATIDRVKAPRQGAATAQPVSRIKLQPPQRAATLVEKLAERYDPRRDQWSTETLSAAAGEQMATLAAVLKQLDPLEVTDVSGLIAGDFACSNLVPSSGELQRAYADTTLTVDRWQVQGEPARPHRGGAGFVEALRALRGALEAADRTHVKFKLFHIEDAKPEFVTRLFYEADGQSGSWGAEQHAVWQCVWSYPDEATGRKAQLRSIVLERFEQARIDAEGGRLFADCTASAFAANRAYGQQVEPGTNH